MFATLDLVKLRESPLAHELSALREVNDVSQECGFDPLAHAKSIAIGVPEKPDGVFGVAITHDLAEADLAKCAERVMSIRSATPRFTQRGSWTVLEQEGILSEATRPKIAYRDGSPLLVARGDYLATMQGALDGASPRAESDSEHAALRKEAIARAHGAAILVATAVLPKSLRDRLKNDMADEAASSESKTATMNAILRSAPSRSPSRLATSSWTSSPSSNARRTRPARRFGTSSTADAKRSRESRQRVSRGFPAFSTRCGSRPTVRRWTPRCRRRPPK